MNQRTILYGLLGVVATAAAVLSFAALRDLAVTCGFAPQLAWLLPVVIDAGAAAGSLAWLGSAAPTARTYGRTLALLLLASSVGGNALGHGLAAYAVRPHWGVVVAVSAIAPAVLGALVHLVVLVGRSAATRPADEVSTSEAAVVEPGDDEAELPDRRDAIDTSSLTAICSDLQAVASRAGRPLTQDEVRTVYGIGAEKAGKVRRQLGWWPRAVEQAERAETGA